MKIERFHEHSDRYQFDFNLCTAKEGWAQVDTKQDAWYYGTWANPFQRKIVNYCEGDVTIETADTDEEFVFSVRKRAAWCERMGYGMAIDGMLREEIIGKFKALGLGDLLH